MFFLSLSLQHKIFDHIFEVLSLTNGKYSTRPAFDAYQTQY